MYSMELRKDVIGVPDCLPGFDTRTARNGIRCYVWKQFVRHSGSALPVFNHFAAHRKRLVAGTLRLIAEMLTMCVSSDG